MVTANKEKALEVFLVWNGSYNTPISLLDSVKEKHFGGLGIAELIKHLPEFNPHHFMN